QRSLSCCTGTRSHTRCCPMRRRTPLDSPFQRCTCTYCPQRTRTQRRCSLQSVRKNRRRRRNRRSPSRQLGVHPQHLSGYTFRQNTTSVSVLSTARDATDESGSEGTAEQLGHPPDEPLATRRVPHTSQRRAAGRGTRRNAKDGHPGRQRSPEGASRRPGIRSYLLSGRVHPRVRTQVFV